MIKKLFSNKYINKIVTKLKLEKYFHRANHYWYNYQTDNNKSLQEVAGYSHSSDVQEAVDKTHQRLAEISKLYIKNEAKILDIGCGPGLYLLDFSDDKQLFGIDLSEKMLNLAKQGVSKAMLFHGDFMETKINESFDLIYSIGMLQYIPPNKIESFMKKIFDSLNPNGILFISYPHAISEHDLKNPDINYINYSPLFLNSVVSKYFSIIQNNHIIDDREITDYDKNPYSPLNKKFDKTYKNSSILVAKKR